MEEGGIEGKLDEAEVTDRDDSAEARAEYEPKEDGVIYHSRETKNSRQAKSKKTESGKSKSKNLEAIANESKESPAKSKEVYGGAVVIFYNVETGEILMEENPGNYGIPKERWRFRPLGGQREHYDPNLEETAVRELGEEVLQEDSKAVLIKNFKRNGKSIGKLREIINGHPTETEIFEVKVPYEDWMAKIRKVKSTHDAGQFYIKTHDEAWSMPNSAFASAYGQIFKELISEKIIHDKDFLKHYKSSNYSMPLVTTSHNHLQTIENIINRSLISMDTSMPNSTLNYQNKTQSIHKPLYMN